MATALEQWRRNKKLEYEEETYLPDYLLDSPYLPSASGDDFTKTTPQPVSSISLSSILRWRWKRRIIPLLTILAILFLASRTVKRRWFSGATCLQNPPVVPSDAYLNDKTIDWDKLAYVTYVTNQDYLCNALMLFESLHRYNSRAQKVMMYADTQDQAALTHKDHDLLYKAQTLYGVKVIPTKVQAKPKQYTSDIWSDSYTKLFAFSLKFYDRVIYLDNDATLRSHLDELFFLPPAVIVAPKAYWLPKPIIGSHILVITPSIKESTRIQSAIDSASQGFYDMEIINSLYGRTCSVLPYRHYSLLTGEFRDPTHSAYLAPYPAGQRQKLSPGAELEAGYIPIREESVPSWDPEWYLKKAKYVHFSDSPYAKPWVQVGSSFESFGPECTGITDLQGNENAGKDCRARDIWRGLYKDFRDRRLEICDLGLSPY